MLAELGYGNNGKQLFWAWTDGVAGTLTVKINGITATETGASDAAHNYCGWFEASVPGGKPYNWQVFINGSPVDVAKRANAQCVIGSNFKILSVSDTQYDPYGYYQCWTEKPNALFNASDFDYVRLGVTFASLAAARAEWIKSMTATRTRNQLLSSCANIAAWDNHEGLDAGPPYFGSLTYDYCYTAWLEAVGWRNPRNNDAGINVFPNPYGTGPEKSTYHNAVFGDVAIITMDHISWAHDRFNFQPNKFTGSAVAPAAGTELTQANWFIATLAATTQPVIILNMPCQPSYNDEWKIILNAINQKNATVVMVTANSHGAMAYWRAQGVQPEFSNYGLLEIQASSMQQTVGSVTNTLGFGTSLFAADARPAGMFNLDESANKNYLCIDRFSGAGYTEFRIKQAITGATRWACRITDGSRAPVVIT